MNPKIEPALVEIAAVIKKYDLVGSVELTDGHTADFRLYIEAGWTCAKDQYDATGQLIATHFKCKPEDTPDPAVRKRTIELTAGTLLGLMQSYHEQAEKIAQMLHLISGYFDISHISRRVE
jgi:hypothetical protein